MSINVDSSPGFADPYTPNTSQLPTHTQSLSDLDRTYSDQGNIELTFSDLEPSGVYELYVFGGQEDDGNQRVIVNQPATDTDILQFNQPHSSGNLIVNDETGDSGRDLTSFAEIVTADSAGELLVRVDNSPSPAGFFGLAGIAIRPAATLTLSIAADSISEGAGSAATTATVTRSSDTTAALTVALASDDTSEATVPATVEIPAGQPSVTFDVAADDDPFVDGPQIVSIVASASGHSDGADSLIVEDDEPHTLRISSSNQFIDESSPSPATTVTITRNRDFAAELIVDVSSDDLTEINLTGQRTIPAGEASVTFGIDAEDDQIADGEQAAILRATAAGYASSNPWRIFVDDDEVAGFVVTQSGGTTSVSESGSTDSFTVTLTAEPVADVQIDISSADTGEATVDLSSLTFTPANWNTPQTVTVTGPDDDVVDGNATTNLTLKVNDNNSHTVYRSVPDQTVSVTTTDDDVAGFTIVESGGETSVDESGTTDTFAIVLNAQPLTNIVLSVVSADTSEAAVNRSSITFTPVNWDTAQTVTVTGIDDAVVDGNATTSVTVAVTDASSDDAFDPVSDRIVSVTTTDDDVPELSIFVPPPVSTFSYDSSPGSWVGRGFTNYFISTDTGWTISSNSSNERFAFFNMGNTAPSPPTGFSNWSLRFAAPPGEELMPGLYEDIARYPFQDPDQPGQTLSGNGRGNNRNGGFFEVFVAEFAPDGSVERFEVDFTQYDEEVLANFVEGQFRYYAATSTYAVESDGASARTITVSRNTDTTAALTVTLTSDDVSELTVPTTVTIPAGSTSVDVPIDIIDDELADGTQTVTITATGGGHVNGTATMNVRDDEVAGFTITESGGATEVDESATTDSFEVVLDAQPVGDVVLDVSSADTGEATVDKATLTFTAANWDTPQTVTVTGANDLILDGSQTTTITVAVDDDNSDDAFDPLHLQTVTVTTTDDDVAAFSIVESDGSTTVDESGTTDTFTVVLDAQPLTDVVLTVVSGDTDEATVDTATLTFTTLNWNAPQTVTVTGVDDVTVDGSQSTTITVAIDDANSNDAFDPVNDQTLTVTTTDDDVAEFSIVESDGNTTVDESGTTDTFTVVLDARPLTNVTLTVISGDTDESTVDTGTLTFTPTNWTAPQTVTVTGVDDVAVDGPQTTTITVAIDDATSDNVADQTVSVTTTDDDVAGFTIVESGGNTSVDESGTTDTFTVVLDRQPLSDVVLTIVSGDTDEATVDTGTLTFTMANWNAPQTVTVTGVNDDVDDGDQTTLVTLAIDDAASNDAFDNVDDQTVSVTTVDDDAVGFVITESDGSTSVDESGTTDTFTVVLTSQPLIDVVIGLDPRGDEYSIDKLQLTFTTLNWNTAQTVTVTGLDDALVDGDQMTIVVLFVVTGLSDDSFDAVTSQNADITILDDDIAAFSIVESAGTTTVDESGTTDSFTVVLDAQPLTDVVLTVVSGDTGEATVDNATLTFTPANWNAPQTVTVTGTDDVTVDGSQNTTITVAVDDGNSDDAFDPVADQTISVTTTDDDIAAFSIVESAGTTSVDESATTDTFTVVLDAQPLTDVVLTVVSGDTGEATVDQATLTFTPANWNAPQTVTVTGVDDVAVDGPQTTTITVAIDDGNSDDAFDPVADQTLNVTTTDDDVAGFTIVESAGSTSVDESGTTDNFTVVLDRQPLSDVVLTVVSSDTDEATVDVATLTFTMANWNAPQTVTVTGINDDVDDGDQSTTITVAVDGASSNDAFDNVADQTLTVTTTDDDGVGFVITESSGATSVDESGTTDSFTVVLTSEPVGDVVLDVSSADTGEATVDKATLTFTAANWDTPQTVTVTGQDDVTVDGSQNTTITVAINAAATNDSLYDAVASQTVNATTTDDDVAAFSIVESAGTTTVDESGTTDSFTVVLDAQPLTDVVLTVVSSDTGEATVDVATLTFTPANWNAAQTVTVTGVNDAIVDGTQFPAITVAIDDATSNDAFDPVANQTLTVTTADNEVAGFSTSESGGSTIVSESGGIDTFDVVLNFEPLSNVLINVSCGDTSEATIDKATLTFTTSNWNAPQTVTVTGADDVTVDGSQTTAITLSIDAEGTDDLYDAVGSQTVTVANNDDDVAAFTVTESGASTRLNETGTTDTITVVLDRQPLSDVIFNVASNDTTEASVLTGALTFTSANWDSPQTVSIAGIDDVTVDGDQDSTITVSVNQGSSDNAFDMVAAQTVSVTTVDDDVAGFSVTQSDGSTQVSETGSTDSFDLSLTRQPLSQVVLTIGLSEHSEVSLNRTFAIFTPANWNVAQTIIVTGKDDPIIDGQQSTLLTVSVDAATSDAAFDNVADQTFTATTTDNDVTTISFDVSGNLQIIDNSPLGLANSLTVSLDDGIVSIIDLNNVLQTSAGTQISDHEVHVSTSSIVTGRIIADLKSGNDSLDASGIVSSLSLDARGGSGNDTIIGTAQADSIDGGSGNDVLMGGSGDDDVDGGTGHDSVDGGAGDDDLIGGGGFDTLLVQTDSRLFLTESLALGANIDAHREFEQGILSGSADNNRLDARFANFPVTLLGLSGNDTLLGGSRGDLLDGGDGTDFAEISGSNITLTNSNAPGMDIDSVVSIEGLQLIATAFGSTIDASAYTLGPVTIIGSSGNDFLAGGSGDDLIFAGAGADDVAGGAGDDLIFAGSGADVVSGGDGDDVISGGKGKDNLSGDSGDDAIFGGFGKDLIDGGSGADDLFGGGNSDTIRGGDGDDFLFGSHGRDLLDGQNGGDSLFGGNSRDTLFGGPGIDFLNGVLRDDSFNGQVGQDLLNGGTAPQNRPASVVASQLPETAESAEPPASSDSDQIEIDGLFSDPLSLDLSLI